MEHEKHVRYDIGKRDETGRRLTVLKRVLKRKDLPETVALDDETAAIYEFRPACLFCYGLFEIHNTSTEELENKIAREGAEGKGEETVICVRNVVRSVWRRRPRA
ncbi:hypothetical protein ES705_31241 [subsurface metagenome]